MKKSRLMISGGGVLLILAVIAILIFQPFNIKGITISLDFSSVTKTYIKKLGLPEQATDISDIDFTQADGTLPEIALLSFKVKLSHEQLKSFYFSHCIKHNLGEPEPEQLKIEPEMICAGHSDKGIIKIYLFDKCNNHACEVHIEARHWQF